MRNNINYIEVNKEAYNTLADEYNFRSIGAIPHQFAVISRFARRLQQSNKSKIRVLDVGCGVGADSLILSTFGFDTVGIDISGEMIKHARKNAPFTSFVKSNFFKYINGTYNGILMDAFIHLFPIKDVPRVIDKAHDMLEENGYLFVSTTYGVDSKEGYFKKADYKTSIVRFRRYWDREELVKQFESRGFILVDYYMDVQKKLNKEWMNFIFQKSTRSGNSEKSEWFGSESQVFCR